MNNLHQHKILLALTTAVLLSTAVRAQNLDQIGVTLLRAVTTNIDGSCIRVAQPEADADSDTNDPSAFEVNPASVNQPVARFAYISAAGATNTFPNAVGNESGHADTVGDIFYGLAGGVATNIAHVDNYDANFYVTNYVFNLVPAPAASIVNQSFTFNTLDVADQQAIDSAYDDYSETFGTLFVSAADNFGYSPTVCAPGTSYNCISVGAYANGTYYNSIGPTIDNGRCKPDITAPSEETSYSTAQVSGAAALLMQAELRGDGGGDTNSASDMRTIKALLLNGAIKPSDWTNIAPSPLDYRYGAGVLNVFNSYKQLAGGKNSYIVSTNISNGSPHPPTGDIGTICVLSGWDFNTNSSATNFDGVNHYYFNVSNGLSGAQFTATATLVWNRQLGETNINNLGLYLYDALSSNLVACSTSLVDNVEHIWLPQLPQGRYDLQVLKNGGSNTVSDSETYALAFEFFSLPLSLAPSGTNTVLSWPVYPTGFAVESTTNLTSPAVWNTNNIPPPTVTDNQNYILLNVTNANQYFRLRRP
jgi:hypothetical protein